jgi:hypothetical protein
LMFEALKYSTVDYRKIGESGDRVPF